MHTLTQPPWQPSSTRSKAHKTTRKVEKKESPILLGTNKMTKKKWRKNNQVIAFSIEELLVWPTDMYNKRSGKYQCVSIKEDINNNKQQHTPYAKALMNLGEGGGGFASHFVSPATYKHYRGPSCFMLMFWLHITDISHAPSMEIVLCIFFVESSLSTYSVQAPPPLVFWMCG